MDANRKKYKSAFSLGNLIELASILFLIRPFIWKTDSITNYVNGFTQVSNTPDIHWPLYRYDANGQLTESRFTQHRTFGYKLITSDSLIYTDSFGAFMSGFKVLKLDDEKLVLKRMHKPFLPGKNQHLYEIRFFSKVPADSLSDAL